VLPVKAFRVPVLAMPSTHAGYPSYVSTASLISSISQLGIDVMSTSTSPANLLAKAVVDGDLFQLKGLLDDGADPNASAKTPYCNHAITPLAVAASTGSGAAACMLIEHGARLDIQVADGMTPLYLACQYGHINLVQLFLSMPAALRGNALDIPRQDGATPLLIAAHQGHADVLELLLAAQANRWTLSGGRNAFDVAASNGHVQCCSVLAAFGVCSSTMMQA